MPARHTTRRILVPLDGTALGHAAIPHLRALATVESEIVLLGVLPTRPAGISGTVPTDHQRAEAFARGDAQLQKISTRLRDITPHIARLTCAGDPADEILRVAEAHEVDLIVMATHGLGTPDHPRAESVTNRVAQEATVPVMILPANAGVAPLTVDGCARYGRIIVPVDGSERARDAMPVAAALARRQCRPVRLVRAIPPHDAVFPGQEPSDSDRERAEYHRYAAWRADLHDALDDDARALPPDVVRQTEVLIGLSAPAILGDIRPGDVIVMTSHGEGGAQPHRLGGIAREIIAAARSPVVLVPVKERRTQVRQREEPSIQVVTAPRAARRAPVHAG
jgi:nucleotide-binding universal stress UspA family protein